MKLKDHHRAYLERVARRLTQESGKKITPRMVLESILDLAIADEELFDPEDPGQPVSVRRRAVLQAERRQRTVRLEPHELVLQLLGGREADETTDPERP